MGFMDPINLTPHQTTRNGNSPKYSLRLAMTSPISKSSIRVAIQVVAAAISGSLMRSEVDWIHEASGMHDRSQTGQHQHWYTTSSRTQNTVRYDDLETLR